MTEYDHDELAHKLAQHLKAEDRMVWENVPAGPSGSVRPDVFVMRKSFTQPNPVTYEIKVSLSDFRSDVTKAKWMAYLDFSYGVVFAVPKGLITKKDLPVGCGLMTYNGEGIWHTVKKPTLTPCEPDSKFLLKLLMGGTDRMTQPKLEHRDFNERQNHATLRKKFGEDIGEKLHFIGQYPQMKAKLNELKQELADILELDAIDRFHFVSNAQFAIKKLKVMTDETERKREIAKQLMTVQSRLNQDIDRIVTKYATPPETTEAI